MSVCLYHLGRSALLRLQPVFVQSTLRNRPCQLFGLACVSLLLLCKRPATSLFAWPAVAVLCCPIQAVCVCAAVDGRGVQVQHASGSPEHMSVITSCNGVHELTQCTGHCSPQHVMHTTQSSFGAKVPKKR